MQKYLKKTIKEYIFIILTATILFSFSFNKSFGQENIFIVNNDINELFEERFENLYDYYNARIDSNDSFYLDPSFLFIDKKVNYVLNNLQENSNLKIIGGFMDNEPLKKEDVAKIATLPTLDEARAKIVGILNTPAQKIISILLAPGAKIAILAHAKSKKI